MRWPLLFPLDSLANASLFLKYMLLYSDREKFGIFFSVYVLSEQGIKIFSQTFFSKMSTLYYDIISLLTEITRNAFFFPIGSLNNAVLTVYVDLFLSFSSLRDVCETFTKIQPLCYYFFFKLMNASFIYLLIVPKIVYSNSILVDHFPV